ncbi:protein phosphatase 2C domain-containing protein [Streptomyces sp. NBRC 110028]|uniref:protein phosphatase 2C domain-containing protein n=1 Tax=Streptomyces sp. NBRC 110028 TaxID=1621260 RepID=UPI0006E2245A|nr:protein phosphatase 2C domain-containing protein [Streptomyces sp. NBRC 110028]
MSQQGDDRRRHENDWWGELYDPARADAGPAAAADSVDERFDSASRTLGRGRPGGDQMPSAGAPWGPAESEPPGGAPGADGGAGGGPRGRRPAEGGDGPGVAPPPPGPAPRRPWRAAASGYVGDEPPVYEAEPTTLPVAGPEEPGGPVPDTVLDGARYGTFTLRAVSQRGDAARSRGEPRRDALLTARFGTGDGALVLVAVAGGAKAPDAARELCDWIGTAVGRSHARLAEDIRAARRGALKSGLHRLTDRGYGRLRTRAAELGVEPAAYTAPVRCLLLPAHPDCRARVFFGVGDGGLFRLRDGVWQDLEPDAAEGDTVGGPVLAFGDGCASAPGLPADWEAAPGVTPHDGAPAPAAPFRFRASAARPGDTLLLCGTGLAEPLRAERALAAHLAQRWAVAEPPGLAGFLADAQVRVKGYADDRTAAAIWEA